MQLESLRDGYGAQISQPYLSTVSKDVSASPAMPSGISLENAGLGLLQGWHSTPNLDHSRGSSHTKFICGYANSSPLNCNLPKERFLVALIFKKIFFYPECRHSVAGAE